MKKVLLLLTVAFGLSFTASAQRAGKFNIGFEAGLPVGDASSAYSAVLGGSLKYEIPFSKSKTFFTLSAGYNAYLVKSELTDLGFPSSFGFVPIKAGVKHYFDQGFFGEGQIGVVFATQSGGSSAFVYSPGVGYTFKDGFEIGFRYEAWPKDGVTIGQLGLRLGYRF